MSLDFQKSTYTKQRGNAAKRTSYGKMNNWISVAGEDLANPYSSADDGVYRKLDHVLNVPLHPSEEFRYHSYNDQNRRWTPRRSRQGTPRLGSIDTEHDVREGEQQTKLMEAMDKMNEKTIIPPIPPSDPVSAQYHKSGGYDDYHKSFLNLQNLGMSPTYPKYGPPRLRNGNAGGSWRHIKEVMQAKGQRTLFVDGGPRLADNSRIVNQEAPGIDLLQPMSSTSDKNSPKWTAHDLEAFKASEAGNWFVMR